MAGRKFTPIAPGDVFTRWTALHAVKLGRKASWRCRCCCGAERTVRADGLNRGDSVSCGCMLKERITTHGMTKRPEFHAWHAMIQRCENANHPFFRHYGGRGITVCAEWRDDFPAFYAHVGPRPTSMSLDRIDNERGYEPGNVRWATWQEQHRNRRDNRHLALHGRTQTLAAWAVETGIPANCIGLRLKNGWTIERALTTPSRPLRRTRPKLCPRQ